jgi:hypothetical protein
MNVWHDDDWDGHELPTQSPLVPAIRLALLTVAVVAALWWLL